MEKEDEDLEQLARSKLINSGRQDEAMYKLNGVFAKGVGYLGRRILQSCGWLDPHFEKQSVLGSVHEKAEATGLQSPATQMGLQGIMAEQSDTPFPL